MKKTRFILLIAVLLIAMAGLAACQNSGKKVSVIFEMNYENPQETIPSQSIEKGGQAIEPTPPERDGFDFTGWFRDKDSQVPFGFSERIEATTVLYAGWRQSRYYIAGSMTAYDAKMPGYNLQELKDRPGWLGITINLTEENKDPVYGGHFYKITNGTWEADNVFGIQNYELSPAPQNPAGGPENAIYIAENGTLTVLFELADKKIYDDSMVMRFPQPIIYGDFNAAMERGNNWSIFSGEALSLIDDDGDQVFEASYEFPPYQGTGEGYAMLLALSKKYVIEAKKSYWAVDEQYLFDGTPPSMGETSLLRPTTKTLYKFLYDGTTHKTTAVEHLVMLQSPTVIGDFSGWTTDEGALTLTDPDKDGAYQGFLRLPAYPGGGKGYGLTIALSLLNEGGAFAPYEQYKLDGSTGAKTNCSYLKPAADVIYELSYDSKTRITLVKEVRPGVEAPLEAPTLYGDFNDWVFEGGKALRMYFDYESGKYTRILILPEYKGDGQGWMVFVAESKMLYDDASGIRWGIREQYTLEGKPASGNEISHIKTSDRTIYLAVYDPISHKTELIKQ
jgi:uncharacterized repeat protein (TIGR02543 family)